MNHKNQYRNDFPLLAENPLVYLDSAATAQKPSCVIQAERDFYERYNANPMRGFYALSLEATDRLEKARDEVRRFINASSADEIIFTRNTTESLNLAAYSYGLSHLKAGDEILVSVMEHHSNLLPWQMAARQTGASLRFLECEEDGRITQERLDQAFSRHTRLVAIAHVSNVLGCVNPVKEIVSMARKHGAVVVLDAAQSAPHMPIDVRALDVDFLAFSGHKLMGPMGIGVLYGKRALLEEMPPFLTGGEMIDSVTRTNAVFAPVPHKFEAGTVNAAGAWGLTAAMDYLKTIGFDEVHRQESALTTAALEGLRQIPHVHVLGSEKPEEHCGILTFTIDGVHPHDVSAILDSDGIAVRAGHHCAQPLFEYLKVSSATRASLCFYNTQEEIAAFLRSVSGIRRKMGYGE
ncbi:cysteine desulfurase [Clostridium sp. FS41]|jgi:cysteine desulfurase / selenocysteine lyase|uniref:aminotransferase class V-fold PLP-dependent enzyme n=1 Tax=Clostridia TaxID=186801 RepID=UPI0005D3A3EA|nr:cysteine desulfurase [Clostridium sp. FS41]KJJ71504.1 cysteine desulfurase SufS [Clostridium sp. FS41]